MKTELVKNWMTTNPIAVTTTTTLPEAHSLMKSHSIRRLPVVNGDNYPLGIISIGDIRGAEASPATTLSIWELNGLLAKLKVKDFMTPDPVTASPEMSVGEAAQLMLLHKASGLPVVDAEKQLVGIITESDIFEMVVLHEWAEDGVPIAA